MARNMIKFLRFIILSSAFFFSISAMVTSLAAQRTTDRAVLLRLSEVFKQELDQHRPSLYYDLLKSMEPAQAALNRNRDIQLMYIDDLGMPVYYTITNLNAAKTISTDDVWPGGSAGLNLTGAGTASNQFAIWDGGGVLLTHQEFGGRVSQIDSPPSTHYHSTHVAGTMVAGGVVGAAKGMSYEANLSAYDWNNDNSEMASAAANGLLISNHSYGYIAGWYYSGNWYWYGSLSISTSEDYRFGFYTSLSQDWDQIAYNAPNYLIVTSTGNDRNDAGPGPGGGHYHWDYGWVWATDTHDPDGAPDGYDCLPPAAPSKNTLTIGAVYDITSGYSQPGDVVQTSFSSWGPTDDGRIKPDVVGNGYSLYSCIDASNSSYASYSGTSMSSPNISGSINLLVRHFENIKGYTPLSATMRAVVIHTADEAGSYDGPDYQNGWGLMNTRKAANLIASDSTGPPHIIEDIHSTAINEHYFTLDSPSDLRVTIAWTDPPGTPPPSSVDPTTPMLVNDLDLRVEHVPTSTVYYPWRLDGANPSLPATRADNTLDNVEVIDIECAPPGQYVASVTHKGTLSSGQQDYALIWSELEVYTPACQISPQDLFFGTVEMFDSLDMSFTIINDPSLCDTLTGTISESCNNFSIVSGGGNYALSPGESLVVTIRFKPTDPIFYSCTIETGNDLCVDVLCTGYGSEPPPQCSVVPDTLDFGTVYIGQYKVMDFTITNTGYQTLDGNVSSPCPRFVVMSGQGSFSLSHDETHDVSILFSPLSAGPDSCTIETGTGLCSDVFCTAYGDLAPVCSVAPDTLDFGVVTVGDSLDHTFIVTNTGGDTLTGDVSETCSDYSLVSGAGPFSLTAGETLQVTVRFKPTVTGQQVCTIETGTGLCSDVFCTGTGDQATGIESKTPLAFALYQNYPNPFTNMTRIRFSLDREGMVSLRIYDISGKLVRRLVSGKMGAGIYTYEWDGLDNSGSTVASGIYFYRLKMGERIVTLKAVLLR